MNVKEQMEIKVDQYLNSKRYAIQMQSGYNQSYGNVIYDIYDDVEGDGEVDDEVDEVDVYVPCYYNYYGINDYLDRVLFEAVVEDEDKEEKVS
ncbi:MAG: hypothetical protein EZS28_003085 [Streblomastix strix]|uniref:Uncharacterized protein n=1 Tax=Streblomastix strix TaxID=222440 RepID=A0A5J4X214_9EUKA|nr:MAG: hypothetical protein EZS28_003085 [Streblomastix strix]